METEAPQSQLFLHDLIDEQDPLELAMRNQAKELLGLLEGQSDSEKNLTLQSMASRNIEKHGELMLGLLYLSLVEDGKSMNYFSYMQFIVRDGFSFVISKLKIFIHKYSQLLKLPRKQLLWLIEKLIEADATETDILCIALLRQIKGGDIGLENLFLIESILDLFNRQRKWFDHFPVLIATSFYVYIRLILDHPKFDKLQQKEIAFCSKLFRDKFTECSSIGRDLIRVLQDVARIPEFQAIWDDLLLNPTSLAPHFQGITSLLSLPSPKRYLQSRLTPQMEEQLLFIMEHVKMGNQKRYQQWFLKNYLSTPESEILICDIVRYICGVFHPPNSIICSDIVQRWAMIGWLLKCVKAPYMLANVKLALFYDYLFFEPSHDNIMNIEPAILVMHHSLPKYYSITATLLEFLVLIVDSYFPSLSQNIRNHVTSAFQTIIQKGVLVSLDSIFESEFLDEQLRKSAKEIFGPFSSKQSLIDKSNNNNHQITTTPPIINSQPNPFDQKGKVLEIEEKIEIEEEEEILESGISKETKWNLVCPSNQFSDKFSNLVTTLQDYLNRFSQQPEIRFFDKCCSTLSKIFSDCLLSMENKSEWINSLVTFITTNFEQEFRPSFDLENKSQKSVLFSTLTSPTLVNVVPQNEISNFFLLLQKSEPNFGFKLLSFISRNKNASIQPYYEFAKLPELKQSLLRDLDICREVEVCSFYDIAILCLREFSQICIGNRFFIHLLVQALDFNSLYNLSNLILQGEIIIFGNNLVHEVLDDSLFWDSFEQTAIWKLINSEFESDSQMIEKILTKIIKKLHSNFGEALMGLISLLRTVPSSTQMVFSILILPLELRGFIFQTLTYWGMINIKEISTTLILIFEECLKSLDSSLFALPHGSNNLDEEKWTDVLQGTFDELKDQVLIIWSNLKFVVEVSEKCGQTRSMKKQINFREVFNDLELRNVCKNILNSFAIGDELPPLQSKDNGEISHSKKRKANWDSDND